MVRLNSNGSVDSTFQIGDSSISFNDEVYAIKIQSDGKILVGGAFYQFAGVDTYYLIRLNSDGTRDTSFHIGNGFNGYVNSIDLQSDGKIIVGGEFYDTGYYDNNPCNAIVRLNTDGSLDSTFGFGVDSDVTYVLVQPDDKILVGGYISDMYPYPNSYYSINADELIRYNADTTIDFGFYHDEMLNGAPYAIALDSNNKIIIGGYFYCNINQDYTLKYFGRLNNSIPKYKYVYLVYSSHDENNFSVSVGSNTLITLDNEFVIVSARSLSNPLNVVVGEVVLSQYDVYPYGEPDYVLENIYESYYDGYSANYNYVYAENPLSGEGDFFWVDKKYQVGDIFFINQTFNTNDQFIVRGCFEILNIESPSYGSYYNPTNYIPYETCEECVNAHGVVYEYFNWDAPYDDKFISYFLGFILLYLRYLSVIRLKASIVA